MNYRTSYALMFPNLETTEMTVKESSKKIARLMKELQTIDPNALYAMNNMGHPSEDMSSWDTMESSLLELSRRHPEYIFEMHVQGEVSDDVWKFTAQNGAGTTYAGTVTITYDEGTPYVEEKQKTSSAPKA